MKRLRLLGAVCACVLVFLTESVSAAAVQYNYTGNTFDTNDTSFPLCSIGTSGCFNNITATIELSAALGNNLALQAITPDAWSISDGLTTITDQTADISLFTLEVGTDGGGNIDRWNFSVARNNTQPLGQLSFMETMSNAGFSTTDNTRYCTQFTSSCSYVAQALLNSTPGDWTVSTVPLPAAVWLFGSGLLGLLGITRRRRSS